MSDIVERARQYLANWPMVTGAYDLVTDLCSEIERLRAEAAWQPIETAPKDGTSVLIWPVWSDGKPQQARWRHTGKHWQGWEDWQGYRLPGTPTHWRQLSAPPKPENAP